MSPAHSRLFDGSDGVDKLLAWFDRVDGTVYLFQKVVLIVLCIAITVINIAQIAGRYIFFYSIPWSEPLSVLLFLAIIFFGQNLATKKDGEIRVEFYLNKRFQLMFSDIVCLIVVGLLFASSLYLLGHAARFKQIIPALYLPYYYVFWMMPVGFGLILFSRLHVLLKRIAGKTAASDALEKESF